MVCYEMSRPLRLSNITHKERWCFGMALGANHSVSDGELAERWGHSGMVRFQNLSM